MSGDFMKRMKEKSLESALETIRSDHYVIEYSSEYFEELTARAAEVFGIDKEAVTEIHRKAVHALGDEAAELADRL